MPCIAKKTFEYAEKAGAIFITQVKNNQKALRNQIAHGCKVQTPIAVHEDEVTKEHGRIEQRKYEVFEINPMLNKWKDDWPYIREVVMVTRLRERIGKKSEPSTTVSYYVSNRPLEAAEYAEYIRKHWWIENKVNYVKDVAFQEDKTIKRVNPYIYAMCGDIALNTLRSIGVQNIKNAIYKNTMSFIDMHTRVEHLL